MCGLLSRGRRRYRLEELKSALYGSGDAEGILEKWVTLLEEQASSLVSPSTVEQEAERIAANFTAS